MTKRKPKQALDADYLDCTTMLELLALVIEKNPDATERQHKKIFDDVINRHPDRKVFDEEALRYWLENELRKAMH